MNNMTEVTNKDFFKLLEEQIKTQDVKFKVKGTSMKPFFKDGFTVVTIRKVETYKKHDIVLFKLNDNYILHRIVKIKDKEIITEGDNLLSKESISFSNIIGKVINYKNKREINTNNFFYKLRVNLWYMYKSFKRLAKKVIRK